jgi:hypothetical protein
MVKSHAATQTVPMKVCCSILILSISSPVLARWGATQIRASSRHCGSPRKTDVHSYSQDLLVPELRLDLIAGNVEVLASERCELLFSERYSVRGSGIMGDCR